MKHAAWLFLLSGCAAYDPFQERVFRAPEGWRVGWPPNWSPDGRHVAYALRRGNREELFVDGRRVGQGTCF